jgi:hypothetical protein
LKHNNVFFFHVSVLLNQPERFLEGFLPSMPRDTSEALGNLVGAAAWVCPNVKLFS